MASIRFPLRSPFFLSPSLTSPLICFIINQKAMSLLQLTASLDVQRWMLGCSMFRSFGTSPFDDVTYLTISQILVLFGAIWCSLALFGPKIKFAFASGRLPGRQWPMCRNWLRGVLFNLEKAI
jgi:hypothetical protein